MVLDFLENCEVQPNTQGNGTSEGPVLSQQPARAPAHEAMTGPTEHNRYTHGPTMTRVTQPKEGKATGAQSLPWRPHWRLVSVLACPAPFLSVCAKVKPQDGRVIGQEQRVCALTAAGCPTRPR